MVKERKPQSHDPSGGVSGISGAQAERLINLLAMLLIKGEPQPDQLRSLTCAGFSNVEIASLLGMTPNAVNIALHRIRKGK